MLEFGKRNWLSYAQIGLCEALFCIGLFEAVLHLPGAVLPVFSQAMLVWNVVLSILILHKRCGSSWCLLWRMLAL